MTCTGTYTTTLGDEAAGSITNHAKAKIDDAETEDPFTVELDVNPALTLVKSADPVVYSQVDELIKYTFVVTNSGDVEPTVGIVINDSFGLTELSCPRVGLKPGDSMTCTGWYVVQPGDVGQTIKNCATAESNFYQQKIVSNESCVEVYYQAPKESGKEPSCDDVPPPPGC